MKKFFTNCVKLFETEESAAFYFAFINANKNF